jgi:hypothetical protein
MMRARLNKISGEIVRGSVVETPIKTTRPSGRFISNVPL